VLRCWALIVAAPARFITAAYRHNIHPPAEPSLSPHPRPSWPPASPTATTAMNVTKKFDRLKQWTNEKMGAESRTGLSDEFKALELEMNLRHEGMRSYG
jgi:hypothetical protein